MTDYAQVGIYKKKIRKRQIKTTYSCNISNYIVTIIIIFVITIILIIIIIVTFISTPTVPLESDASVITFRLVLLGYAKCRVSK